MGKWVGLNHIHNNLTAYILYLNIHSAGNFLPLYLKIITVMPLLLTCTFVDEIMFTQTDILGCFGKTRCLSHFQIFFVYLNTNYWYAVWNTCISFCNLEFGIGIMFLILKVLYAKKKQKSDVLV